MAKSFTKSLLLLTRTLHIYLSMFALLLLLFFAATGFMMNHGEWFGIDQPAQSDLPKMTVPDAAIHPSGGGDPDERAILGFLRGKGIRGEVEGWSPTDDPIHLVFKTPRDRYEVDIARADGAVAIHKTTRNFSGMLTAMHRGEDTGAAWHRIIDITSILLALISLTGLVLWITLAKRRTLGIISLVVCIVLVTAVFFIFVP